ncbi:hypothetical protein [Propionibacterium acidifaciens]|uniref:hypothetical protein n=1 Tax=Propionibacterium acidifaciens TaxID=556499 RepID=UPI0036F395E1
MLGVVVEGVLEDDRRTITYACDRSGRRTVEEHSDGRRREYEWTGLWTLSAITDHSGDTVARTTTVVDALGQLTRVNDEEVFFDDLTGRLLQAGDQTITHAGLPHRHRAGWLARTLMAARPRHGPPEPVPAARGPDHAARRPRTRTRRRGPHRRHRMARSPRSRPRQPRVPVTASRGFVRITLLTISGQAAFSSSAARPTRDHRQQPEPAL